MKVNIKIQSISDIITNSSSEVFCTITSKDIKVIEEILKPLFPNEDSEFGPVLSFWEEGELSDNSEAHISIELPYGLYGANSFYKAGLEAILNKVVGENNYNIKYES